MTCRAMGCFPATTRSWPPRAPRASERVGRARGEAVAILAGNRAEFLVAYFGTMRAGLVSVPVNHKFPPETIDFVMRDSGAKLVFCDRERRAQLPAGIPL